ncbi:hypothetical protein C8J56DRAFT_1141098 [Mycena floridula]|nr:hypothetical protein C8J56DRAFT_1141098 [Mycena floridula]
MENESTQQRRSPLTSFFNLPQIFSTSSSKAQCYSFESLAASLLLFSVSAIPAPAGYYYDPVKSAPGRSYDAVRDAPSSNIDSRPLSYGAYAPSVPPLAPQPSTPDSPARASGSSSTRSKQPDVSKDRSSSKAASKRQRSPNDGGSPSSQLPAKAIKGPQLSDRPFACQEANCGKRYKRQSELTRHSNGHNNPTKYKCDHPGCTDGFPRRDHLTTHKRTHDPDKPKLKCSHKGCEKISFARKEDLTRHMRSHDPGAKERYACTHCDFTSSRKDKLKEHDTRMHQKTAESSRGNSKDASSSYGEQVASSSKHSKK